MTAPIRVAVLISGGGSNMLALAASPGPAARVTLVISNRPGAPGLDRARAQGIETLAIDHRPYGADRAAHEAAIHAELVAHDIELVCLAGYMRLLTPWFVGAWAGRMLNIHPSLLPAYPGLHTHARALAAGARLHGCTVHWVTETMDEGPILGQAAIAVMPDDTAETLAARVLVQEHRLYPAVLASVTSAEARAPDPAAALLNPLPAVTSHL